MAIVHILGSVKDKHYLLPLAFLKNMFRATLNHHLPLVASMYSYTFFCLKPSPYNATFDVWIGVECYGIFAWLRFCVLVSISF
jgi:hypothetical protein